MYRRLKLSLALCLALIGLAVPAGEASAFWGHRGFGPFGFGHHHHHGFYRGYGWGYPSYGYGYGYARSYRSLSISVGLPSYGYSYPSYYSANYYSPYCSAYSVPYYSAYSAPVYTTPVYYAPPVYYVAPTVTAPVYYYPSCNTTTAGPVTSSLVANLNSTKSFSATSWNRSGLVHSSPRVNSSPLVHNSPLGSPRGPIGGGQLVSTAKPVVTSTPKPQASLLPLPQKLLDAVDAIFAAGGYSDAAAAYARLTVRYGSHDQLVVRRFIALVASGDCDQAAVIVELAAMTGQDLSSDSLPNSALRSLYGQRATDRNVHVERLAEFALTHPDDAQALRMVGIWLALDGQAERAQPFMERAALLSPEKTHTPSVPRTADFVGKLVTTLDAR